MDGLCELGWSGARQGSGARLMLRAVAIVGKAGPSHGSTAKLYNDLHNYTDERPNCMINKITVYININKIT